MRTSSTLAPGRARPVARGLGLLVVTIVLGLATRRYPPAFPELIAWYGGDTLWAAMVDARLDG